MEYIEKKRGRLRMKRWQTVTLAVLIVIILGSLLYVKGSEMLYASRVESYLLKEQGYAASDIAHIEGHYGMKLPTFYVTVVFSDEQHVTYIYYAHNGVLQAEFERDGVLLDASQLQELKHVQ